MPPFVSVVSVWSWLASAFDSLSVGVFFFSRFSPPPPPPPPVLPFLRVFFSSSSPLSSSFSSRTDAYWAPHPTSLQYFSLFISFSPVHHRRLAAPRLFSRGEIRFVSCRVLDNFFERGRRFLRFASILRRVQDRCAVLSYFRFECIVSRP